MTATALGAEASAPDVVGAPQFDYVPALDGIRAIAVVAVMLFHQSAARMPGGFLGVDLFFVLSGYLITSLLLVEAAKAGRINFLAFWGRRARRLLPAIFVLLVILALFSAFAADPITKSTMRGGALATLFFVKNYWDIHRRYVSVPAHTWTLSVEEQFYVVWPLALTGLLWLRRRWRWALHVGIVVLMFGSAMCMVYETAYNSQQTSLESRAQTLLLGALAAVVMRDRAVKGRAIVTTTVARWAIEIAGLAALVVVIVAFFRVNFYSDFNRLVHGGYLAFAFVGVGLVVAASQPGSPVLGRVLSLAPMRAIGRVSYGLYLYHLPIFLWVTEARTGLNGAALFALRAAITAPIVVASYFLVERPIRQRRVPRRALAFAGAATAAVLCVAIVAATPPNPGLAPQMRLNQYQLWLADHDFGTPHATRVLLAGDVLAASVQAARPTGFNGYHIKGASTTYAGCSIERGSLVSRAGNFPEPTHCALVTSWFAAARRAFRPDVVVLMAGQWEVLARKVNGRVLAFGTPALERDIDKALDRARLAAAGDTTPVLLTTVPCAGQTGGPSTSFLAAVRDEPGRAAWVDSVFERYAARHARQVRVIDLRSAVCVGGRPRTSVDGESYVDRSTGAFSPAGAQFVWQWLDTNMRSWLAVR